MKTPTTHTRAPQIKPTSLRTFHAALGQWYRAHGRHDLPWRTTADPYHIWVSEVMLQQTQVATVRDRFYGPFLATFPTLAALANADETEVLKAWEGLGYYSRARNLHKAAQIVVSRESRVLSIERSAEAARTTDDSRLTTLLTLPGIGRNTAHAIAAFAYHQPVAILEANVKRVVARIFALESPSDAQLWAGAESLMGLSSHLSEPSARSERAQDKQIDQRNGLMDAFDYNQAMMDLGSMVCTPKRPACSACPARSLCKGKTSPERYPTPKVRKQTPERHVDILVREDVAGKLFLEARDAKLLGGMYGFPQVSSEARVAFHVSAEALAKEDGEPERSERGGAVAGAGRPPKDKLIGKVTHTYSHFKLIGRVMHQPLSTRSNSPDWYSRNAIDALPLSKLDHKVLALVDNCHTRQKKRTKPRNRSAKR